MTSPRSRNIRSVALTLLAIVGALIAAPALRAQTPRPDVYARDSIPAYRYRLIGVYDDASGTPIDSVRVTDIVTGLSILTSRTGTATLIFLPEGGSIVRLQKIGYETKTLTVAISRTDTVPVTAFLMRVTILARVDVKDSAERYLSPSLRDFERRKKDNGFGHFIDEAEMRKHDDATMANLLTSHFVGLMPAPNPSRAAQYLVSSRTMCAGRALSACRTPNCYPEVYVDGVRYMEAGSVSPNAVDFSKWSPNQFAAAEFYAASEEVPEELGGSQAKCGAIALWTRER